MEGHWVFVLSEVQVDIVFHLRVLGFDYARFMVEEIVGLHRFSQILLWRKRCRGKPTPSVLRLVIVLLVLEMQHVEFLFSLFELSFEPGHLFLIWLFTFLELYLQQSQFLHSFFDPLFVLAEHAIGCSVLGFESLIDILKFDNFFLKVLEPGFEVVSLAFYQLKFFFQNCGLVFFLFLKISRFLPWRHRFNAGGNWFWL